LLLRGTSSAFVLRVAALSLNFATTFLLARFLGPVGFGAFAWSLAVVTVLRLLISGGFNLLLVREAAAAVAHGSWARFSELLGTSIRFWLVGSAVAATLAVGGTYLAAIGEPLQRDALLIGVFALPGLALLTGWQAVIQGTGAPGTSRFSEDFVLPSTLLILIVAVHALAATGHEVLGSVASRVIAVYVALGVAYVSARKRVPAAQGVARSTARLGPLFRAAGPLLAVTAANAIIADVGTSVVGAISGSTDAGVYAVASRVAALVGLAELAVNATLMPLVARLHATARMDELGPVITRNVRAMAAFAVSVGCVLSIAAPQILGLFGAEFSSGAATLRILVLGWILNMFAGSASLVLVMTGREGVAARGLTLGLMINIPAAIWFSSMFGPAGAAWASVLSVVIWNSLLVRYVWKWDGLDVTVLGKHRTR
jgi:O-antigen/teichoic acid export membrane protein